jgi:hypothetical protein
MHSVAAAINPFTASDPTRRDCARPSVAGPHCAIAGRHARACFQEFAATSDSHLPFWNQPEASSEVFVRIDGKRFLRTGDLACVDQEGCFKVTEQEITDWSHGNMAACEVPRIVEFVGTLPKSGAGGGEDVNAGEYDGGTKLRNFPRIWRQHSVVCFVGCDSLHGSRIV